MKIFNAKQLKDLQKDFNNTFPYLKIEFFKTPPEEGRGADETQKWDTELTVGEIRKKQTVGFMPLKGDMSVDTFEKIFENNFGLFVQVYRKSHGKWIQTWASDIWTLEEQNNRGKILGNIDDLLAS